MKTMRSVAGLLALVHGAQADEARSNPLAKVLDLLGDLSAKIKKEGEQEAKAFNEFSEWCKDATTNTNFDIRTSSARKEKLEAKIGELSGNIQVAESKIDDLAAAVSTGNSDLQDATVIREKEAADFTASENELMEVIDTLGRAITVLDREMQKNPAAFAQISRIGAGGLVQTLSAVVDAAGISGLDRQRLLSLAQSSQGSNADDDDMGAPDVSAYKTHSTNILDTLEDLKEKAESQLSELRKAEVNARHNYEMLKQSLEDQAAADTKDMEDEKSGKALAQEGKASAQGELQQTVNDLANSHQALEIATTNCMQTAADHDATDKAREEELKVIANAMQVLRDTTGGAEGQTYALLQLQARSTIQTRTDLAGSEVIALVKRLAKKHHSSALAQLASRIAAVVRFGAAGGDSPFVKVKGLIQNLIERLEQEASAEATEKAYCDEELAKTEAKKDELNEDISKLNSKIDQAAAKTSELKEDVKELQSQLAALAKMQAEMDKMRHGTNADYVQAKADLELGLEGVRQALVILRDYYASKDASMLQAGANMNSLMQQPALPEQHEKASGAGKSIIGILEVVESDFARNLAKTETSEADMQSEYEKMTQENSVTRTLKNQDVKYKSQEVASLAKRAAELSSDRENENTELSAVLEYYGKLKERCIAKPQIYEQRKERREAEIAGLKDALRILEEETAFVQRKRRGVHMRGSLVPN